MKVDLTEEEIKVLIMATQLLRRTAEVPERDLEVLKSAQRKLLYAPKEPS